jgi:hypothetical protein
VAQIALYRTDQASIGVTVAGLSLPNESWDSLEGRQRTVEGKTVMPGGQLPQRALGGIAKRGPATLKKLYTPGMLLIVKELEEVAGYGLITITYSVKVNANAPAVFTETYTGVVGNVELANYDADKESEPAYINVMADLDGNAQ